MESLEPVEDFPDERERIGLLLCEFIECPVVDNRLEFVVLLLEEEQGSPGGVSSVDTSSGQVLINPFPEFSAVSLWHRIKLGPVRYSTFHQFNVHVNSGSPGWENVKVLLSKYFRKCTCPIGVG